MTDSDVLMCRFCEGTIVPTERKQLYGLLEKQPAKLEDLRAILVGSNSCPTDFEDVVISNNEPPSILRDAATFVSSASVLHGKRRYDGLKRRELTKSNIEKMLSDLVKNE